MRFPKPRRWRMTAAWLLMGALVTVGFYAEARDDQERCKAGNEFRRVDLPAAFHEFGEFLGEEFGVDPASVEEANARFAGRLDDTLPERSCRLF